MSESNQSNSLLTVEECLKNYRLTRDFDLYLDMLNRLKSKYMIVLCLKNTEGQNISEQTAEKIHNLGFSNFTAEPDMRYVGVFYKGSIIYNSAAEIHKSPASFDGGDSKVKLHISFDGQEGEININGKNHSLNDKGINIVVYDPKKSEAADVCCYNASEGNPTFYHLNFYYDEKYIDTHIYMPESFKKGVVLPLKRSYFSPRSLNVKEVERGIFLPRKFMDVFDDCSQNGRMYKAFGGICDENFNFIAGHQLFSSRDIDLDDRHITGSYKVPPKDISYIDETVLYGGVLIEHPGHLITECFADRLWWLTENPDSDIKIAIEMIWTKGELGALYNSFVMEFLDAFGISKDRIIVIKKPTQFKKIIVPDQSSIPLNYCFPYDFTPEYIKPFQHITKRLTPGKYKKIYLTKSKVHNKSVIGEEYFIDFFEKKGFAIINPEDYSIKEKAELMYGADEVVTIDGTSSLFTVFCKPSVKLTILARKMDYWNIPQQLITEALGIKEFFLVNISGNFLDNSSSFPFASYSRSLTFTYVTKEFKKYVKYIYNEELEITSEESLKKYFYDYLAHYSEYYSIPIHFESVRYVKITDILRSMSEVFLGKAFDSDKIVFLNEDEYRITKLENRIMRDNEASAEKIKQLSDKAKELVDEITRLKQSLAQRDAEIEQLRSSNAEMASYVAEINRLLDSLEAEDGSQSE